MVHRRTEYPVEQNKQGHQPSSVGEKKKSGRAKERQGEEWTYLIYLFRSRRIEKLVWCRVARAKAGGNVWHLCVPFHPSSESKKKGVKGVSSRNESHCGFPPLARARASKKKHRKKDEEGPD